MQCLREEQKPKVSDVKWRSEFSAVVLIFRTHQIELMPLEDGDFRAVKEFCQFRVCQLSIVKDIGRLLEDILAAKLFQHDVSALIGTRMEGVSRHV